MAGFHRGSGQVTRRRGPEKAVRTAGQVPGEGVATLVPHTHLPWVAGRSASLKGWPEEKLQLSPTHPHARVHRSDLFAPSLLETGVKRDWRLLEKRERPWAHGVGRRARGSAEPKGR